MKKTTMGIAVALIATQAWAKETQPIKSMEKHSSYIGTVTSRSTNMHSFKNIDEACAVMKEYINRGEQVKLSSYEWTEKGKPSETNYMVIVKKGL